MKVKGILCTAICLAFLLTAALPGSALAKRGGIGNGGGTQDGVLYHSHSDRSYSGRDMSKGKGKALGKNKKDKKAQGSSEAQSYGEVLKFGRI